ncbi:MAG: nicotinate-nucleotide adenylyltransferase [Solirubrobacteraceae bacterium]
MRVGILGGSFNPPHLGHLVCAQEAYLHMGLALVILIPARIPPHKPIEDEPGVEHRLELCRLAVGDDERFTVSDLEAVRPGPSYTVDTLAQLHRTAPDNELFLIVGGDAAARLPSWREPERLLSLASPAVAKRRGTARAKVEGAMRELRGGERTEFFPMPRIGVSSTMVRRRVKAERPIRYIVPDAVAGYIGEHGLYGGRAQR